MDKGIGQNQNDQKGKETASSICLERIISQLEPDKNNAIDLNTVLQEIFKPSSKESPNKKSNLKDSESCSGLGRKELDGFLLAFDGTTEKIIFASGLISKFLNYTEIELLDKNINEILHSKSGKKFENIFSSPLSNNKDLRSIKPFICQFQKKKDENNNDLDTVEMKCSCIWAGPKTNSKFKLNKKDVNGDYCICLATPSSTISTDAEMKEVTTRGPPNQTIHTRTEIPQPEIFKTRHDIVSGEIIAIENQHNLTGAMKDELITRCLYTLNDVRSNGISLIQSLIRQALGVGQATTPAYKFRLAGGRWVTAQSKSSLVNQTRDQGSPMFIVSTHSIYRDGTLDGLNLNGISPSMRNILTAPVVSNSSSTFSSTNTVTTATVRTSSFSNFSTIPNTVSYPDSLNCLPTWSGRDQFRPRNSVEVARELLASTGADHNDAEELANSVLSPPPHLDGHLVHAIGGSKTKSSLKSTSNTNNKPFPTDNLATFPGPPCVDISNFTFCDQHASLTSTAPMFVNGITTMRMEAAIATKTEPPLSSASDPLDSKAGTSSFDDFEKSEYKIEKVFPENFVSDATSPSSTTTVTSSSDTSSTNKKTSDQIRVVTPPEDKSFSAPISPVVTRPRSASTNNTVPSASKSLKRSASTSSQDSGIVPKSKAKHSQPRRKSKDAKPKTNASKDTILSKLLKCKNLPDEIVSTALGTLASKQSRILVKTYSVKSEIGGLPQNSIFPTTTLNLNHHATTSIPLNHSQTPHGNNFAVVSNSSLGPIFNNSHTPDFSNPGITPLIGVPNPHLPSFSEATSVSKEELDELDDILESLNEGDIFSPTFTHNASVNPPHYQPQHTTNILANILENNEEASAFPSKNFNSDSTLGVQPSAPVSNPIYFTSSPQNMSMMNPNPSPQTLIGTPNLNTSPNNAVFMKNTSPQMFSGGGVSPIIEQCPNKTITPNGAMTSRGQPSNLPIMDNLGNTPLYRGMNGHESWEGKEPLVDLGSIPPPHGVNPRLPIPTNFNVRMNGITDKMLRENRQNDINYSSFGPITANNNLQSPTMPNMISPNEMMTSPNSRVNGAPGFLGNTRLQSYDVRPGMQALTNGNGTSRSNQDLRHQLHLRLHQPNSFDGDRGRPPSFPMYNLHPRTDMTTSGILAQQKNEYFMKQKMMEQRMESSVVPYNGRDGMYLSGPQNIVRIPNQFQRQNSYSPRQQFSPPVGAMHSVRSQMMTSYNPAIMRQNSAPNYPGGGGSPQSPMLTPNLGKNLHSPNFNSPPLNITSQSLSDKGVLGKTTPTKRTRAKKTRKSTKSKSTLNLAKDWNGGVGNFSPGLPGLYSHGVNKPLEGQSPVMSMRVGNMPQRPVFTAGGFVQSQMTSSPVVMTSSQNNMGQTINLNLMIDQNNLLQDQNPVSSFMKPPPDGISESFNWSDAGSSLDVGIDLNNLPSSLDSNLNQDSIAFTNGNNNLSFFGGVALNSNTNNNNPPTCRYRASMTSSPLTSNGVTPQSSPMKRSGQRKTSLLETLLLS